MNPSGLLLLEADSLDQLRGTCVFDLVDPRDRENLQALHEAACRGTAGELSFRLIGRKGTHRWVETKSVPLRDETGDITRTLWLTRDITERIRLAERDAARERQLTRLYTLSMTLSGDPADVFDRVVRILGDLFQTRVVCLSEIVDRELYFRSVLVDGQVFRDAGRCPISITPCATVEADKDVRIYECVSERFPQAGFLQDHNASAYCGLPALNNEGEVVAVICLLDDKPREFTSEDIEILRLFAQRVASEIERGRHLAERRRYAERLHESERRYRRYVDSAPHGMFVADAQGRYVEVNAAACRITGYDKDELLTMGLADTLPADYLARGLENFAELRDQGVSCGEFPFVGKAGRRGWWTVDAVKLSDDRYLGFVTDITARKSAEEQLRHERDFTQQLIEAAPAVILLLDLEGRIRHINPYLEQLSGYSLTEVQGRDWFSTFLPERDRDRNRSLFEAAISGTPTCGNRNPIVTRSGEEREIEWYDERLRDIDGRITGLLAVGQDVTDRKLAEELIEENHRRLRHILDSMFCFVGLFTPEGILVEANRAPLEAAGLSRDEVIGKPFAETYWWSHSPKVQEQLRQALARAAQGETVRYDTPVRIADGRIITIDVTFGPLYDDSGRVVQIVGSAVDVTERKQAEEVLKTHSHVLMSMAEGVNFVDADGIIRFTNHALDAMFGYETGELVGRHVAVLNDEAPDDNAGVVADVMTALAERGVWVGEFRNRRKDGTKFWTSARITQLEVSGQVCWISVQQDISDRKRAEAVLRETAEFLRVFIHSAPAGVAMLDRELRYIACSRRWLTDYQLGEQDLTGRSHYEVFPEIPERWKEIHRRCLSGISARCEQDRFERADGSVDYVRWEIQPWWDTTGAVGGLVFFTEMITDRVRAETALRESEERLLRAQGMARIGNWDLDLKTNQLWWSEEIFRIFELDPLKFGSSYEAFLDVIHPDDREAVDAAYSHSVITHTPYNFTHRLRMPDGRVKYVQECGETDYAADGRPLRSRGTVQDITERVRIEQELRDSLREKEILLREVHHRVKNNLQIISSLLYFQEKKARHPAEAAVFVDGRNRLYSMTLVHEKLYLSRDLSRVDFSDYIRSLVEHLRETHATGTARIDVRFDADPVELPIDAALPAGMVVCELVTNVFKYAFPGERRGELRIAVRAAEGSVMLTVSDNGVGLPADFNPERADSFGWRLIVNLCAQLAGTIELDTTGGTRVTLAFRIPSAHQASLLASARN